MPHPQQIRHAKSFRILVLMASWSILTTIVDSPAYGGSPWMDNFSDLSKTVHWHNVARRRAFPRIVTRPDVRINPSDPAHYMFENKACGYGWFPFILRLHSGTILCVYREGVAHVYDRMGRTVVSSSTDGGRTWDDPQQILFIPEHTTAPGGICQTNDGSVWVSTVTQFYDSSKGLPSDPRAWMMNHSLLRSIDDGKSWVKISCDEDLRRGIEMSNGELMWLGSSSDERGDPIRATIIQHEVNGQFEWKKRPHPELGPTNDEWAVIETATPGVLVCMMRQQQHSQYYATAKSNDYGRTWTPWRESNVYMGPFPTRPMLRCTQDNVLLFTYGQRWIGRTFVVASFDEGETWDVPHRQTILHSPQKYHKVWDSHYTDIARAEGDVWIAVDYIATPSDENLRGIYGTFLGEKHFRNVYEGATLAKIGTTVNPQTIGHWSFDELEGKFARDRISANFGEIHGPKRVRGCISNGLEFNGQDAYVEIFDDATLWLPKYFTLEAWVHTRDGSKDQTILSKAPRYTLALKGGKLVLEIGTCTLESEMTEPLPSNEWVHVAVVFAMRHLYSRATFFINGEEHSWSDGIVRFETFDEALSHSDVRIVGGKLFQEFGHKNTSTDNLVIGMDNDLKNRPFDGMLDEIAIHQGGRPIGYVRNSYNRRYHHPSGVISSLPIARPPNSRWQRFEAQTTTPTGTKIVFRIEDKDGKLLTANMDNRADISDVKANEIILFAELTTSDAGQSPILHHWSVTCEGDAQATIARRSFPDQAAAMEGKEKKHEAQARPGVAF